MSKNMFSRDFMVDLSGCHIKELERLLGHMYSTFIAATINTPL